MDYRTELGPKFQVLLRVSTALETKAGQIPNNVEFSLDPILKTRLPHLRDRVDSLIERLCVLNGTWDDVPSQSLAAAAPEATSYAAQSDHLHHIIERVLDTLALITRRLDRTGTLVSQKRGKRRRASMENDEVETQHLTIDGLLKKRRMDNHVDSSDAAKGSQAAAGGVSAAARPDKGLSDKASRGVTERPLSFQNTSVCRVPRLTVKPHAIDPIPEIIESWQRNLPEEIKHIEAQLQRSIEKCDDVVVVDEYIRMKVPEEYIDTKALPHPYERELTALQAMYTKGEDEWGYDIGVAMQNLLFKSHKLRSYQEMDESPEPIVIVDGEGIEKFIDTVNSGAIADDDDCDMMESYPVLAVDLEHHSAHSYRGLTCLIQMSFNNQDYIVDTLAVPKCYLTKLNQVFTNPAILKVLHGSHYDVLWLQELADIYLVNVFDTYFASKLLKTSGGNGLAALVELYCNIKLDKGLQMSDWRQRPLTQEMIHYARSDTHYLPYIFSCMRNQLLTRQNENDLVASIYDPNLTVTSRGMLQMIWVMDQSRQLCLNRLSYDLPNFASKAMKIKTRFCTGLQEHQMAILIRLLAWRDLQARKADIAPSTILPERLLLTLAQKRPRTQSDVHRALGLNVIKFPRVSIAKLLTLVNHPIASSTIKLDETLANEATLVSNTSQPSSIASSHIPILASSSTPSSKALQHTTPSPGEDYAVDALPAKVHSPITLPNIILRGAFLKGRNLRVFTTKKTKKASNNRRSSSGLGKLIRAILG